MDISPLDVLSTELVVLKPRYGSNGMKVQVVPKNTITKQMLANDVYIAQEFIDSSKGIPNVVNQRHEMRVYIFLNITPRLYCIDIMNENGVVGQFESYL